MSINNSGRYAVPFDEDFEPNSNNAVLKNFLNIKSRDQMDAIEYQELKRTENEIINIFDDQHQFSAEDICNIHELWLGDVYPCAGKYRTVTMSKEGFLFASPEFIEASMRKFERKYLRKYTPCHYSSVNELILALSIVHVELIIIHPFREGNGRTTRLLADLMVLQANRPPINFESIDQIKNPMGFGKYIAAIHAGVLENYEPIQEIFRVLLE